MGALSLVALHAVGRHIGLHANPRLASSVDITSLLSPANVPDLPNFPRVLERRRLASSGGADGGQDLHVDGSYQGKCTSYCPPTGGVLSIVGIISGQCDCFIHVDANRSNPECPSTYAKDTTCCGSTDNYGEVNSRAIPFPSSLLGLRSWPRTAPNL